MDDKSKSKNAKKVEKSALRRCPYCALDEEENREHLWWKCPAWAHIRRLHYGDDGIIMDALNIDNWLPCTRNCAIANKGFDTNVDLNIVQPMYVDIFKARYTETLVHPDELG